MSKPQRAIAGYSRFTKQLDPNFVATFENVIKALCCKVIVDAFGGDSVEAFPVFIVDPVQAGASPIRPATILLNGVTIAGPGVSVPGLGLVLQGRLQAQDDKSNSLKVNTVGAVTYNGISIRGISASNSSQVFLTATENLHSVLSVSMTTSGGTATLLVEGSSDGSNFITVDSIAAAGTTQVTYHPGGKMTSSALTFTSTGLNPLAYRWLRITAGTAGVGNTTQLDIGLK